MPKPKIKDTNAIVRDDDDGFKLYWTGRDWSLESSRATTFPTQKAASGCIRAWRETAHFRDPRTQEAWNEAQVATNYGMDHERHVPVH
jgi:hypothetical protein